MEVNIIKENGSTTVKLEGRLDTPAAIEVSKAIEPVLAPEIAGGVIILECQDMSYISSSGLRIFLTIRKASAAAGGKVIVRHISKDILPVFMMTGFLNLFQIEDAE